MYLSDRAGRYNLRPTRRLPEIVATLDDVAGGTSEGLDRSISTQRRLAKIPGPSPKRQTAAYDPHRLSAKQQRLTMRRPQS